VARAGTTYTACTSGDGVTWSLLAGSSVVMTMTGTALGGLAVAANSPSALSTAQFDAVTLVTQTATTLGNAQVGASQDTYDSSNMDGSKVTTGARGARITSMTAYVGAIDPTAANDRFQTAIYADSSGSPGALVAANASGTLVANSWNTVALTATLAPNTTYWLMYNANGSAGQYDNLAYDNGPAGSGAYYAPANQAYGVWPASFGMSAGVGTLYSLYATLAAPGGPIPTPMPSPTSTPSATATPTGTPSAGAGTPGATSLFGYTPNDQPYTATLNAGSSGVIQEQRFYDGDNHLTCLQAQGPYVGAGSTLRQSYAYGYSPLGVTTAISTYAGASAATTCGGSAPTVQAVAGDAFGRLTASGGITWTYDANDNLTSLARDPRLGGTAPLSLTYAYTNPDGSLPAGALPNELLAVRYGSQPTGPIAAAYGYDGSGDTVAITTVNATAGTTTMRGLAYDATGRLTGITSTDGLSVTVGYNARGLRASLAVSDAHPDKGNGNAANFVERMTYRGDRLGQVAVVEGTASFTETFLYRADGEPLELLYQQQGQAVPTRYYYAVDGRGDVTALVNAQGVVVNQYGYDLWGAATAASGGAGALGLVVEGVPQPLRYRGYVYDAWYDGAGLWSNGEYISKGDRPLPWYWLGARAYDPALERFLQPDPSALDGARSYAYCHDAPADCADPSGLVSQNTGPEPPVVPPSTSGRVALARTQANALRGTVLPESGEISIVVGPDGSLLDGASGSYDPAMFDRQASIASAQAARQLVEAQGRSLLDRINRATNQGSYVVTAIEGGLSDINGYGAQVGGVPREALGVNASNYRDVLDAAQQLGIDYRDPNVVTGEGRLSNSQIRQASHAEKMTDVRYLGVPQATSSYACSSCSDFLGARAGFDGVPRVVADPYGVTIYYPDGTADLTAEREYPVGALVAR